VLDAGADGVVLGDVADETDGVASGVAQAALVMPMTPMAATDRNDGRM
jgi:hypothetical protein